MIDSFQDEFQKHRDKKNVKSNNDNTFAYGTIDKAELYKRLSEALATYRNGDFLL